MSELIIVVGGEYLNTIGQKVFIVRQTMSPDVDHEEGYSFVGNNGVHYSESGGSRGNLEAFHLVSEVNPLPEGVTEGAPVTENLFNEAQAAYDQTEETKAEKPKGLLLEAGQYYRNGLGQIVLIIGEVIPGTKWYNRGFRFCDQRNSFYTAEGSVKSRIFGTLDLLKSVAKDDLTDAEQAQVIAQLEALDRKVERLTKIIKFCDVAIPIACGFDIGAGLAIIRRSFAWGLFGIGTGVGGLYVHRTMQQAA